MNIIFTANPKSSWIRVEAFSGEIWSKKNNFLKMASRDQKSENGQVKKKHGKMTLDIFFRFEKFVNESFFKTLIENCWIKKYQKLNFIAPRRIKHKNNLRTQSKKEEHKNSVLQQLGERERWQLSEKMN